MRPATSRLTWKAYSSQSNWWKSPGGLTRRNFGFTLETVDRLKELIKYKGFQVAPAELEGLLLKHPAVADAAVIPCPDAEAGEVPKAFVVLKGPATPDDLIGFVNCQVAPYKKVRQLELVPEIPESPSGKILRRTLIERGRRALFP